MKHLLTSLIALGIGSVAMAQNCHADFTYYTAGQTTYFYDMSTANGNIVSWYWTFGDGGTSTLQNPTHAYGQPGAYLVCLSIIDSFQCTSIFCDSVWYGSTTCPDSSVIDTTFVCTTQYLPVCGCDSVTYQNACVAYYYHGITQWTVGACDSIGCHAYFTRGSQGTNDWYFYDLSTSSSTIISWYWDFGDGDTSTQQNPFHTYQHSGMYYVCLTIWTADSCTDTYCDSIWVGSMCAASFFDSHVDSLYQFYDASYTNDTIVSWYWDFGDGGTSTQQNPIHVFPHTGVYLVCLTITTSDSCTDTYCEYVHVGTQPCEAYFTLGHQGTHASFIDLSTGNNIIYWFWDFGDGNTSTQQHPFHQYAHPGTYYVCLTIWTADSCTDTWCDSVWIGTVLCPDPSVIDTTVGCPTIYDPVCGCDSVTYANECVAYYYHGITQWTHGPCGPSGTCHALFSYQSQGLTVTFSDQSTASGTIIGWWWDFGDGNGSIAQNPVYTYTHPGTYLVCLTIITSDSCYSSWCDTLTVHPTGIDDPITRFGFNITPNPARDQVTMDISLDVSSEVRIDAVDISGRTVGTIFNGTLQAGSNNLQWNVSSLSEGVYFVKLSSPAREVTKKVVVIR